MDKSSLDTELMRAAEPEQEARQMLLRAAGSSADNEDHKLLRLPNEED